MIRGSGYKCKYGHWLSFSYQPTLGGHEAAAWSREWHEEAGTLGLLPEEPHSQVLTALGAPGTADFPSLGNFRWRGPNRAWPCSLLLFHTSPLP